MLRQCWASASSSQTLSISLRIKSRFSPQTPMSHLSWPPVLLSHHSPSPSFYLGPLFLAPFFKHILPKGLGTSVPLSGPPLAQTCTWLLPSSTAVLQSSITLSLRLSLKNYLQKVHTLNRHHSLSFSCFLFSTYHTQLTIYLDLLITVGVLLKHQLHCKDIYQFSTVSK